MLARFEGEDGKRRPVDLLSRQMALTGMAAVAEELAGLVAIRAVPARAALIQQDGDDSDLFFVLTGRVSVQVHGREVAVRGPGTHVGEMAMIDPAAKRCANVVAIEDTVLAAVTEGQSSRRTTPLMTSWPRCNSRISRCWSFPLMTESPAGATAPMPRATTPFTNWACRWGGWAASGR